MTPGFVRFLSRVVDTPLARRAADAGFVRLARRRVAKLDALDVPAVQAATLRRLVRRAAGTAFGRGHGFASVRTAADFQRRVPLRDYDQFWATYWQAAYPHLAGTTWPDFVPYYALSSGTTTGATKYIPVTADMVRSNKKAALTTLALFRAAHPESRILTGKFFFLGGSTDLRRQPDGSLAGDLSGIAAKELQEVQRPFTFPPLELSLIPDWEVKLHRLAAASLAEPITAISGVPSWMLKVFDAVKQISGKPTLAEAWPHLRLVIHGGTLFDPYRAPFRAAVGDDRVKFCEVYPCSEGFVAAEDPRYPGLLRVVPDHGVFFEFVPVDELTSATPTRHTLADVVPGVHYAVVVTSCAGVWAYLLGDTVRFESRDPPLLKFTGRTKFFLSAFGEHLIQEEVDRAVARAAAACGVYTEDHHVGPVFPVDVSRPGYHLYLVEFRGPPPDPARFAAAIDAELGRANEDYAAHRAGDLTMLAPVVRPVPPGGFGEWMKSRGKFGGQNKVPRMDNTGALTRQLVAWLDAHS